MAVRSTSDAPLRNATQPVSPRDEAAKSATVGHEPGVRQTPAGVGTATAPLDSVSTTPGVSPSSELGRGVGNVVPPPLAPPPVTQENAQRQLDSFAANLSDGLPSTPAHASVASMSADELYALFLKLNAMSNSDEQKKEEELAAAITRLQHLAIENAKAAIKSTQENLKQAETQETLWKGMMGMLEMLNPIYTLCKACGVSKEVLGYIDPIANACEPLANNSDAVEAAKADLEGANKCLDELMTKTDWARLAELQAEYEAQRRAETASADETGVPTKGLSAGLKAAASKAAAALAKISADQGFAGMIGAAPKVIRDLVLPVLLENGVKHAEFVATMLGVEVALKVTAQALASGPDEGLAAQTIMLGKLLEAESGTDSRKLPTVSDATTTALETVRTYATETAATAGHKRGTFG